MCAPKGHDSRRNVLQSGVRGQSAAPGRGCSHPTPEATLMTVPAPPGLCMIRGATSVTYITRGYRALTVSSGCFSACLIYPVTASGRHG